MGIKKKKQKTLTKQPRGILGKEEEEKRNRNTENEIIKKHKIRR